MAKQYKLTCKHCGKEFYHTNNMKEYCSDECKQAHKEIGVCLVCGKEFPKNHPRQNTCSKECHRILHLQQSSELAQKKLKAKEGIEGYDFVTCKECGAHLTNFNDKHFAMHGLTRETYEAKYGKITQWTAQKYIDEKLKGSNNPGSKERTTEIERKRRSPFSKEFYINRGIEEQYDSFMESLDRGIPNTTIEYYLNKGMSPDEAEIALRNRQRTATLSNFIRLYGKEEGTRRYKERNDKWIKSLKSREDYPDIIRRRMEYRGYSMVSQDLFDDIHKRISDLNIEELYAERNGEKFMRKPDGGCYFIDYTIPSINYALEFNGECFHARKDTLTEEEWKNWRCLISKITADESYEYDTAKAEFLRNSGYMLDIVWESDFLKDRERIVDECVKHIRERFKEYHNPTTTPHNIA